MLPQSRPAASSELTQAKRVSNATAGATSFTQTRSDLYWEGFNAYCNGAPLEEMQTFEERNGWWFANETQAEADAADYLKRRHQRA